jgi:hypothetical protein
MPKRKEPRWIKKYGLKAEIRYRIFLPYYILKAAYEIIKGYHKPNDFSPSEWFDLNKGICDVKAGRLWEWADE